MTQTQIVSAEVPDINSRLDYLVQAVTGIGMETPVEAITEVMTKVNFLKEFAKKLSDTLNESIKDRIIESGHDVHIPNGDGTYTRYYVGNEKKTKCRDAKLALDELLKAAGGDVDEVVECLSSDCWKHGAAKKLLERHEQLDRFDALFQVTSEPDLKTGKPKLQKMDDRFLR